MRREGGRGKDEEGGREGEGWRREGESSEELLHYMLDKFIFTS